VSYWPGSVIRSTCSVNCPARVTREGYSHELASCRFWPGCGEERAFYAYSYPDPSGHADHRLGGVLHEYEHAT
jgi:hypothetical protein